MTDPIIAAFRQRDRSATRHRKRIASMEGLLTLDDRGQPVPSLANAIALFAADENLRDLAGYDEFRDQAYLLRPPPLAQEGDTPTPGPYPRAWLRSDVALITAYLQRTAMPRIKRDIVEDAMEAEASRSRFHPIRAYLDALEWDGLSRIDTWLHSAFGTPLTPYTQAIGAKFLIAAVRRVRRPGVKFDHAPVAQGPQGAGKSSTLAALFGEWFSDALPDNLGDKDAAMALRGVWGLEMAELTQILATEAEAVKAFLTRTVDRYRPPYGRQIIEIPRQGVLFGTTNAQEWLRDATGNRRWWPFDCIACNPEWVAANRNQLWAEAAAREKAGETHWLDDQEAKEEAQQNQEDRMIEDPWHGKISDYIEGLAKITVPSILENAISMPVAMQNRAAQMRVASILTRMGWQSKRSGTSRFWLPP